MTSPSCPVISSRPLPFIRDVSMNKMSPPTGVHARPVATPGAARALGHLAEELRPPRYFATSTPRRSTVDRRLVVWRATSRATRVRPGDLPGELPHARLAGVVLAMVPSASSVKSSTFGDRVLLALLGHQVLLRDGSFSGGV
jgi:hypothetical protein